jgi:hypothetical protein
MGVSSGEEYRGVGRVRGRLVLRRLGQAEASGGGLVVLAFQADVGEVEATALTYC